MTEPQQPENNTPGMSRRKFLKNGGLLAGGLVGGSLFGGLVTSQMQKTDEKPSKETATETYEARTFFGRDEDFNLLSAATERLFPKDDIGPGAIALGVPYFIDRQLSGQWGMNSKEYMNGPFPQTIAVEDYENQDRDQSSSGPNSETQIPLPTPRYQSRMTRAEIFMEGIYAIERTSQEKFEKHFVDLEPGQQDEILQMFDDGEPKMNGIASTVFFNLLLQTTIEGAYADPAYGGNRNMEGWRMKEYPGPRMSYANEVASEKFIVLEQQSLRNYQGN